MAIQVAIQGNLAAIEMGQRPARVYHTPYRPFRKYPKHTGFLALYVHLYVWAKSRSGSTRPR